MAQQLMGRLLLVRYGVVAVVVNVVADTRRTALPARDLVQQRLVVAVVGA